MIPRLNDGITNLMKAIVMGSDYLSPDLSLRSSSTLLTLLITF